MQAGMIILLLIHILAAVIWVGGMVFAHYMMRPAVEMLEPPTRLKLFRGVLERFFPAIGGMILLILASGFGMIFVGFGGFAHLPEYINVMMGLGIVMMLAFGHVYFAPWKRMKRALDAGDVPRAAAQLRQIRLIITFNLYLGLIVVAVGATGRYWGV